MFNRLTNFFEKEFRKNGLWLILMTFSIALFLCMLFEALFFGLPDFKILWMFSIAVLSFLALPLVYILGVASRNAEEKNTKQDLIFNCLEKISEFKDSIEPGQTIELCSGYTYYNYMLKEIKEILQSVVDPKFKISVTGLYQAGPYKIRFRLPKLPVENNSLIET